ncbi:MAG: potassium/proton antiporter [Campylobacterales bacterium]|nr:potassium/proton antiporter [Campylobacterales bacterium]
MAGTLEVYLIIAAGLMLLSVVASKLSDTFGIPALFIFLGIGMLAGSDGVLGIYFDDAFFAKTVGTLALIFILFAGGLDTLWKSIRPVLKDGLLLATVGVILTAGLVAGAVYVLLEVSPLEALLLGAIISSTDAAAVFAIFRAKGLAIRKRLSSLLELESGSNDPMAIFLTITILQIIALPQSTSFEALLLEFVLQFLVGGVMGYGFGVIMPSLFNKLHLAHYGLYTVFSVGWVLLLFGGATFLGGNGFLAVYIAGICINAREFVHKKNLIGFHDGLAWVMQIWVFLTLGLLVFPSELPAVALPALGIALWLIFVARPVGILITLCVSTLPFREKLFASWVGLRGAVPIILATYPFIYKLEHASLIFNTVFFIVLTSILIQGGTLPLVARILGVEAPREKETQEPPSSPLLNRTLKQFYIDANTYAAGKSLAELTLPLDFLVLLLKRKGEYIKPTGSTIFIEGDLLLVQCEDMLIFNQTFNFLASGPKEQAL